MSITSREYAYLANDAYVNEGEKHKTSGILTIGQTPFRIEKQANNPATGYQGAIYRNLNTGELVVAHRGTEMDDKIEALKDGVIADGGMVFAHANTQANDAIALTREAVRMAKEPWEDKNRVQHVPSKHSPAVSVTGHSLGGTLAQISAHHFGLRGETFNAYGAASLGFRIPKGGNAMVNHVVGTDVVSAASPHYGQVRQYVTEQQIGQLRQHGFKNDDNLWSKIRQHTPAETAKALGAAKDVVLSSHKMENFLDRTRDGKPSHSVLNETDHQRAVQNQDMIGHFRDKVQSLRKQMAGKVRGPVGKLQDSVDALRGDVPAGEPAAKEPRAKPAFQNGVMPSIPSLIQQGLTSQISTDQLLAVSANRDVQALYDKLHEGLAEKITRAGGGKWLESMLAETAYTCMKNGINANNIGFMDINADKNNILVMTQDKQQFAAVNATDAAKTNLQERMGQTDQLHETQRLAQTNAPAIEHQSLGRIV